MAAFHIALFALMNEDLLFSCQTFTLFKIAFSKIGIGLSF
ncbi:hypothetical protein VRK_26740 [Vibrio sp. MEBiC08052]|nr:hypothetical protein VRK_26740 [Vibrio sp. MEBiC08052]